MSKEDAAREAMARVFLAAGLAEQELSDELDGLAPPDRVAARLNSRGLHRQLSEALDAWEAAVPAYLAHARELRERLAERAGGHHG